MGEMILFKCPKCGNKVEIYEGIGEVWCNIDINVFYPPKKGCNINFYHELDKKIIEEIHKFVNETNKSKLVDLSLQPYLCKNCGKIEAKLYFKIENGNKIYTPTYVCRCGGKYKKLTKKEQKNITCNKCGNKMMRIISGFWD